MSSKNNDSGDGSNNKSSKSDNVQVQDAESLSQLNSGKLSPDILKLFGGNMVFSESSTEEEVFHDRDLIELFPYGISITQDFQSPYLILKDKTGQHTLPVFVHPLEASLVLNLGNKSQIPLNPHGFLQQILEMYKVQINQCVFVQIKGSRQYVRLYLSGVPSGNSVKIPVDQAMSLCVSLNIPIKATKNFINQSKILNIEIDSVTQNLVGSARLPVKNPTYIQ